MDLTGTDLQEKARQLRNAYMREYRKRNPEKIKEINKRYWIKRASLLDKAEKESAHNE